MLPASFAADVPVFIATPTSAWASAGASFVPSPVMATSRPPSCSALDQRHLVLGRRLGEEVVDAGLLGDRAGGHRVVARDHHGADPHPAQVVETLADAGLDDVLEVDDAEDLRSLGDDERRAACRGDGIDGRRTPPTGVRAALGRDVGEDRSGRALAHTAAVDVDAAHPGLRREGDPHGVQERALVAGPQPVHVLAQHDDRAALGRLVRQAAQLRGVRQLLDADPRRRDELDGLPVARG